MIVAARSLGSELSGKVLRCGIDNTGVVYMLNTGTSGDPDCMVLLRELAELQLRHSFDVVASWVPREMNIRSDLLSRLQGGAQAAAARSEARFWTPCRARLRRRSCAPSTSACDAAALQRLRRQQCRHTAAASTTTASSSVPLETSRCPSTT